MKRLLLILAVGFVIHYVKWRVTQKKNNTIIEKEARNGTDNA